MNISPYVMYELHYKNNVKFFQRKNNDRKALTTIFGKFITDVLIFAATITFI